MDDDDSSGRKPERKVIEKQRRDRMKALCSNLTALIPPRHSRSPTESSSNPIPNQLDQAANYITKLQANLEELKNKKSKLTAPPSSSSSSSFAGTGTGTTTGSRRCSTIIQVGRLIRLPDIHISTTGSLMNVALTTGLHYRWSMFNQILRILHDGGAEVLNANFSVVDQTIFHTVQAQIGDWEAIAILSERLKKFVYDIDCIS